MSLVITNVRAVVGPTLLSEATIVVDDGVITDVVDGVRPSSTALDGRGLLVIPGLIDTHSDGLEKEANPRRTAFFPMDFALGSFEGRVRAAGITTLTHGVAYQDKPRLARSVDSARAMYDIIQARREEATTRVDHQVLYRVEARDESAVRPLVEDILDGRTAGSRRPLVSFEDHTPGQGQFRDRAQYEAAVNPEELKPGQTAADYVDELIAEAEHLADLRDKNLALLSPLAKAEKIVMLAHDPEDAEDIARRAEAGAHVAEFPVSLEAAQAAREHGMPVVMGAPNALRGSSHSGNASARELVAAGLCQVIASDYMPSSMLASVYAMVDDGIVSLPDAIALVTSGPAAMLGLDDRGTIAEGKRADLLLVDDSGPWPQVMQSWSALDFIEADASAAELVSAGSQW